MADQKPTKGIIMNTIKNQIAIGVKFPTAEHIAEQLKGNVYHPIYRRKRLPLLWLSERQDLAMHFNYKYVGFLLWTKEITEYAATNEIEPGHYLASRDGHCFILPKDVLDERHFIWIKTDEGFFPHVFPALADSKGYGTPKFRVLSSEF
jgi:hypothetical protein